MKKIIEKRGCGRNILGAQPAAMVQLRQVDQQFVAGEGGRTHIGRIAGTDAAQRQNLPKRLCAGGQPVDEMPGGFAKVAGTMRARQ